MWNLNKEYFGTFQFLPANFVRFFPNVKNEFLLEARIGGRWWVRSRLPVGEEYWLLLTPPNPLSAKGFWPNWAMSYGLLPAKLRLFQPAFRTEPINLNSIRKWVIFSSFFSKKALFSNFIRNFAIASASCGWDVIWGWRSLWAEHYIWKALSRFVFGQSNFHNRNAIQKHCRGDCHGV